jgi:hypothetical protein
VGKEFGGGRHLFDRTLAHDGDATTEQGRFAQVVRDQERRQPQLPRRSRRRDLQLAPRDRVAGA